MTVFVAGAYVGNALGEEFFTFVWWGTVSSSAVLGVLLLFIGARRPSGIGIILGTTSAVIVELLLVFAFLSAVGS